MADYDFSGLDDVLKKTPTAPIAPPVPVSAPEAAQPKYDFSSLDTPNDQAASAAKAAALFEASFRNPSEEAKKRNLSDTIQRMSGEYVSPAVMDVGEAQRQADRLAADHATRASPRTSAFLSVQENANVAMQDAKVMAQIEASAKHLLRGAVGLPGQITSMAGAVMDVFPSPTGLHSELSSMGRDWKRGVNALIPEPAAAKGVLSEGWMSGMESLGMNVPLVLGAAALTGPAAPATALSLMALASGGGSVQKAQDAGAGAWRTLGLGTADAVAEYVTEKIGIKYLMDIPGLKNAFLKTAAKFAGAEMAGEQVATVWQDFNEWALLNPTKTLREFGDERGHAAAVTAIATIVGGGGQVAIMKGASALMQSELDKGTAETFGARLSEMAALTAQLETTRLHLPTAQSFWQEIAGDSSVFIDQDKLTETLAEAGVDVSVLPSAAAQMAEARPEGIEIPVSELMTGLANTKAADAIIQHVRMAPDAESIFEHNQPIDKQLEFFQQEATRAVAAETRTAAFNAEVKQIEDDLTADLTTVGTYGKQASATQAKVAGAWYATVADKWGVTPLQIRDGWTAADGRKYPGWRPRIKGTPMQGFNHGQAMLNVGLDVGATDRAQKIDADFVKAEIEKMGVKVLSGRNVPGEYELNGQMVKELTYVPRLSRPLTEAEVNQLAVATGQEAIGHYAGGKGDLWGPNAANWGAFNPEFFKDQMGGTLLGEQAALAAQQGGLEQAQSSRRPTTAKKPEDHLGEVPLTVDYTKIEPEKNKQNMALVASYPGIRFKARDATKRAEEFIQHVTANLLWLHDQIPADIRQRSKRWYDGARAITDRWSAKYGKSDAQIAAVLAVYSPQRDWFTNVSLAERTLDIVQSQQNAPWSPEMSAVADKILADEKFAMLRGAIEGKKLSDLKDRLEQAAWLRTFDEAHNNRGYRLVTPEGGFIEMATSGKGVEKKTGWPGFGTIIKALYILDDGSSKTIDNALGGEHKVRSFYNNIFHPTSDLGFVTIDTHAVAAGLLRPLSGNSVEVAHNFGGAGTATSAATGMSGTYAYYQEAYRRAAEARGLLPREMQSITWEAVRELYTMGFKHDTAKMAVVDKLWSEYEKGKRDLDSVRAGILNLAGGVEQPSWVGRDSGISPEGWASTYTGELLGDSVPRRDTGDMDGGAGERAAAGTAGANLSRKLTDHEGAVAEYNALNNTELGLTTEGGRVLNTDLARELSPEYRARRSISQAVHEPASAFIKKLYAEKLAAPTPAGLQPIVVFTAGGTGAGKSSGLKHLGELGDVAEIIYDTNMNTLASATKKIEQALAAGRSVTINYTYRDPVEALTGGALPRAMRMGRTVPLVEHAKTHVGSREVIAQLEEKYQGDDRVAFVHVDNSNGLGNAIAKPLAEIPEVVYDSLQENLNDALDKEHQAGRISDEVRRAFRESATAVRPDDGAGDRGQSQPRGAGGDLAQLNRNVGAVAGPVVGIHYSKAPRASLASSAWGTGMRGAEGDYVRASADKRLRHRITFYVNTGNGINPESDVGTHAHAATLRNLYDVDADALKIWRNNPDERVRESAVLDAGFDGFLTRTFGKGGAVVMLGQRNLQPEYLGNYASTAWDLPKELKDKAVAAAQAVHQKLAGDTSREDMRASGKVVQVNSLQDLNETYPEAQAAAFTELLEGFGKPNDAETVAGFLEGRTGTEALAAILATQDVQKAVQDRAAVVPPAVLPPAKQAAMALIQNKQLISGQQNLAGWQKDVARIVPDIADQIDWSKLESGKMYYKSDLAATLWQGREQWYFSALENALKAAPAKVFTSGKAVAQWLTANAGKMSVKAAEIEATGITDWLETQGKVTKEDVVAFMAQGGVRLEETVLGAPTAEQQRITAEKQAAFEAYRSELVEKYGRAFWGQLDAEERRKYDALNEGTARDEDPTKFASYVLPGGENYREWLLTLPSKETPEQTRIRLKEKYPDWKEGQRYDSIMSPEDQRDLEQSLEGSKSNFRSSHFAQPNILAHIRFNERTDADGKRVLFIEEIQSDWAQKGRKDGFNVPVTAYQVFVDGVAAGAPYESKIDAYDHKTRALKHNAPDKVEIREVQALQSAQSAGNKGLVPLAPFVTDTKSWTALALKRMIAHAVENGFDSVAWTTGEQQAARYDLSKQVSGIAWQPGTRELYVRAKEHTDWNDATLIQRDVTEKNLADYIGKAVAENLLSQKPDENGYVRTEGENLKVGGEGMKGYYDGIVPQVANDVLKKLGGGKVGEVTINQDHDASQNTEKEWDEGVARWHLKRGGEIYVVDKNGMETRIKNELTLNAELDENGAPRGYILGDTQGSSAQPGFTITPRLAEAVSTNGLPLFAGTPKKGSFSPATLDLRLLADADLSTFLHETSHFFLAAYTDMASQPGAPKALVDEVNAILAHLFKTVPGGAQVVTKGGNQLNQTPRKFVPLDEDAVADLWENRAPAARDAVLREFFARQPGELQSWPVVPAGRLKKIWADHAATGVVRDEKGLDTIVEHIVENYVRLEANTALLGHTSDDPVEMLRDYLGDRYSNEELEKDADAFAEYAVDENGAFRLSDYGLFRIAPLVEQLVSATTPEQKLTLIDMVLNVVHQRSDLAAMFVEGGTSTLTDLALFQEVGAGETAPGPLPEGATPLEIWSKMSLDQQRPYHEAWAEQGEQYFMTGKAPSLALESAFRTFANWLKKIYTSVKEFVAGHTGGALHPDTAAFFDRMLATEAEIKLANEKRGFVQLFKDAAEAGMTERGFADYTALTDEQREDAEAMLRTRSLRDMKWLQNSRDKVIAALQADAKEARAAVRKTIAEELAATPLRKAMRWLKTGEMTQPDGTEIKAPGGFKMTKADVEALFPPGALADRPDLSRLRGMTATEGLAPDLVAEMFDGFTSGEDLVRQLAAAPKFNDEVEALTNQRMLEEHSDLVDPAAIAKAADAAIHNDARIRLAATELAALNSRIGSVAALTRAAKEYARQLIETKTSRTLKPWQFAAADTRARKAAAKALRKGERDEAAAQMRTALVNAAATKLAYDAEDDIKKITDRFKKIAGYKDTDSAFKSRDAELVNAVRAILADFGIGTKGKSAREYLAVVQQHNPDLAAVLSDTIDAVTENAKDWQQLKISELRDLAEEIDGLWFLAKRSKQIEIDGKVMPLHEAQQALYDRLDALGIPDRVPGEGSAVTPAEKRGILFDRFVGALRRVEAWVGAKDGTLTGPFRTYMWNPIRDAADAYRADKAKYLKAYRDLLTPIAPTLTRRLIEAPELGYTFGKDDGGMGKAELLHAILHTGNESNKRKLLLGRGWATATENSFDTSKWDAFVQRMHDEGVLTKADYDFAQGAWNLLDNMKPLAQKAHRDVFGKYFAEVTANEFTNQFGTYAGGYVPAMTDPLIVRDAELNKLRDGEEGSMAYAFPTTAKGFTKSRVEYNRPLKLDLRTLSQHIDKVLLFGHMTRPVNDVRRVMSGKAVAQALGRVDPQAYNTLIMPWLNRAAKQVVETPTPGREGLGRFWSVVRARAGMAAMFANVANSAQQITGLSLAAVRVRPALLLDAMAKYAASPATFAEHVTSKSSYMATRLENEVSMLSDQINDILLNPSIYESAKNWTSKHAYFMQSAVDSVISPVVWLGGYNQAIEAGMSETDAVRAGDSAVRETQGSQAPEDVAAFETGSAFYRMFVQFAGYFNMNANLLGTEFVKLSRDMGLKKGAGRGLYVLTLGFLAPAIAGELIIQLFRGGPDDDDKDGEYLDDWLVALFGYAPLRYATAMVPGIGPAVNATVNTLNNKPYDDRISTAPAISMIEAAVKAPIDLYKAIVEDGKPSKAIKEIATLISMTVGVPASAAAKPASYLADVAAGRVAPTSIPDAVRGTITGTASPASKQ